jgi:hypothetical protein
MALLSGWTFENELFTLIQNFYMETKLSLNQENPPAAKPLLAAGDIVVVKFLRGEYVIRTKDHDKETMLAFFNNGDMRAATKEEREYWRHAYATTDYYGVSLEGLKDWLEWRKVACR